MKKFLSSGASNSYADYSFGSASKDITIDNLIIGALESAFLDMVRMFHLVSVKACLLYPYSVFCPCWSALVSLTTTQPKKSHYSA
jgi:hypothetical protein